MRLWKLAAALFLLLFVFSQADASSTYPTNTYSCYGANVGCSVGSGSYGTFSTACSNLIAGASLIVMNLSQGSYQCSYSGIREWYIVPQGAITCASGYVYNASTGMCDPSAICTAGQSSEVTITMKDTQGNTCFLPSDSAQQSQALCASGYPMATTPPASSTDYSGCPVSVGNVQSCNGDVNAPVQCTFNATQTGAAPSVSSATAAASAVAAASTDQINNAKGAASSVGAVSSIAAQAAQNAATQAGASSSVAAADAQQAAAIAAAVGVVNSQLQFPSDYARRGEAAAAAATLAPKLDSINTDLQKIDSDLTTQSAPPSDPVANTQSDFQSAYFSDTFTNLLAWRPSLGGSCPTSDFNFSLFGQVFAFSLNSHCTILEGQRSNTSAIMVAAYTVLALFIVLGA